MQGDEETIRRKAYELWEEEGRPEGRHDEHWHKARQSHAPGASQKPSKAADVTPDAEPDELSDQDKALTPGNAAEVLSQTAESEKPAKAAAKRPRTQKKKTPAA